MILALKKWMSKLLMGLMYRGAIPPVGGRRCTEGRLWQDLSTEGVSIGIKDVELKIGRHKFTKSSRSSSSCQVLFGKYKLEKLIIRQGSHSKTSVSG